MIAAVLAAAAWLAAAAEEQPAEKPAPSPFMQTVKKRTLGCPVGTHPVEDPVSLRCVMDRPEAEAAPALSPWRYSTVRTADLSVDFPAGWHETDAWGDDVPTVSVEHDPRGDGRPVTLMVSKVAPGQDGYQTMAEAIRSEKEARGARETARRRVAGLPARETVVSGESRSVYVDAGDGAYYLFVYSATGSDFKTYERAFVRLLSSARFLK